MPNRPTRPGATRKPAGYFASIILDTQRKARAIKASDAARARKARDHRSGLHTFPSLEAGSCYRCAQLMLQARQDDDAGA